MWCAILWGAWYIPGTAIWYEAPYKLMSLETQGEYLLAAVVITTFNAFAVLLFLFLWIGVLQKWDEFGRTLYRMRKISKWYFLAAIFGGPFALFGSYLAIGFVGPVFAAIAALIYPVVGATLARLWYNERITARAALGIFIIIAGGVSIYAPGILTEMSSTGSGAWIGYLGGALAAIGWGVEGAIAGRALDVSDPDAGITIRFTAETLLWVVLVLPCIMLFSEADVIGLVLATFNIWAIIWLLMAGLTFGFCYVAWYKSFPLIGVGRGQALGAFHAVFAVVFLAIFTLDLPEWYFLIGLALTILGGFVMITESSEKVEVVRAIP
jgi:drug/metabolite transporter (DMT)-like permease